MLERAGLVSANTLRDAYLATLSPRAWGEGLGGGGEHDSLLKNDGQQRVELLRIGWTYERLHDAAAPIDDE